MSNSPISFLTAVLVFCGPLLPGCQKTPCEELQASAESCGSATSPYVPESQSSCNAAQEQYGAESFDSFAECITAASCENTDAVLSCQSTHLPDAGEDPCSKFTLWSIGCGLEPNTTDPECGGLAAGLAQEAFTGWVECITADGCPSENDDRYVACQTGLLPTPIDNRLQTCNKIKQWAEQCGPLAPPDNPISFNLVACLAQGQVVTAESFEEYADCLLDMVTTETCDSNTDRVLCAVTRLKIITPSDNQTGTCERLIQLGEACAGPLTGNSLSGCVQLFSTFTEESFGQYVDCVEGIAENCNESADFSGCLSFLKFPS